MSKSLIGPSMEGLTAKDVDYVHQMVAKMRASNGADKRCDNEAGSAIPGMPAGTSGIEAGQPQLRNVATEAAWTPKLAMLATIDERRRDALNKINHLENVRGRVERMTDRECATIFDFIMMTRDGIL